MLALRFFLAAVLACGACVSALTAEAAADQITSLPGTEQLSFSFKQYSGYLGVEGQTLDSRKMHYWFVESTSDPANDPTVFWTNGGPGCSGLIGFMTEQGPFRPNADMTLSLNEYAWNKAANMVFIESPTGVGFSYSDYKQDYDADDASTAKVNYQLIQAFFKRFPELAQNKLYISSESYGVCVCVCVGCYVCVSV